MKNKSKIPHLAIRKSNMKIVERGKIDTPNTKIYGRSLSWLCTGTSNVFVCISRGLCAVVNIKSEQYNNCD